MESRVFVKLALEIALKNERALATSSRTLSLLYTAESTEVGTPRQKPTLDTHIALICYFLFVSPDDPYVIQRESGEYFGILET